jgi:hypothetical protein
MMPVARRNCGNAVAISLLLWPLKRPLESCNPARRSATLVSPGTGG